MKTENQTTLPGVETPQPETIPVEIALRDAFKKFLKAKVPTQSATTELKALIDAFAKGAYERELAALNAAFGITD